MDSLLRGYNIFVLNLYPVQYIPKLGEISYFEEMKVIVTTTPISKLPTAKTTYRDLPQDQARVLDVIDNPVEIDTYSTRINTTRVRPTSIVNPADTYEYVIITNSDLKASFLPLADWKNQTGVNTTIITVNQITSEPGYSGTDTQAEIRNFIFDAYTNWETEYVLLGGDDEIIPYRGVYIYAYGSYYDYDMPCDMYYGALDGNWDNDGDGNYGEGNASLDSNAGGTAGEEADLYAEVYVGRATVDTASEATNFVNKIVDYEQHPNVAYLNRALMVGEYLGWGGVADYGGNYKDEIADYIPQYTITTLYERDGTFSDTNVITRMNLGTHIVNHMGHANQDIVMDLSHSEIDALTNTEYFLVYSQSCYSNAFDENTSGSSEAVSEHFIFNPNGAFAYIGNTRYGWGAYHSTDGPSQEFDREFFDALSHERIKNVGKALQDSKEDLIGQIGPTHCMRWCYFTLNLLGDPETEIATNFTRPIADIKTPKGSSSVANIINIDGKVHNIADTKRVNTSLTHQVYFRFITSLTRNTFRTCTQTLLQFHQFCTHKS